MEKGTAIGPYVADRKLGDGGMAEVWLAHHAQLGTPAAIKFLSGAYSAHPEMEQRFQNEGRRQGLLDHPAIVKVYGFEKVAGRGYLLMQYVEGESLDTRIQRLAGRPMPVTAVWRIAKRLLEGLSAAHAQHLVHRDLKPSNILIDNKGDAYLGDFGLVVALNEQRMTRAGAVMGTALYMSPEQIQTPLKVDHRADIYSFGCVLFELLTGRTPFEAEIANGEFAVKLAHAQKAPPRVRSLVPEVPQALEDVVARCLAKKPDDRFRDCGEVLRAMDQAVTQDKPPPPPRRERRSAGWLAVLFLVAAAAYYVYGDEIERWVNGRPGGGPSKPVAQAAGVLFGGLYQAKSVGGTWYLLRFYRDGSVIGIANRDSSVVAAGRWMYKGGCGCLTGRYVVRNGMLTVDLSYFGYRRTRMQGSVTIAGFLLDLAVDRADLGKARELYSFTAVPGLR